MVQRLGKRLFIMAIAKTDTKCCKCSDLIKAGQHMQWHEVTRSGGRSNGGYGSSITIKTGKFLPQCMVCQFDERITKITNTITAIQNHINFGLSEKFGELQQDRDRISELYSEMAYLYLKANNKKIEDLEL